MFVLVLRLTISYKITFIEYNYVPMHSYVTFDQMPAVLVDNRHVKNGKISPPLEVKPELHV